MYIPPDIIDLIIDQLVLDSAGSAPVEPRYSAGYPRSLVPNLLAASLVSTHWVNRSQYYLFSTVKLYRKKHIVEWCSNIRADPRGVSRHVRVLQLGPQTLHSDVLESALPHLISFPNLRELVVSHGESNIARVSLDVLTPIFSSFAATLKELRWTNVTTHDAWKTLYTLTNLLPNLVEIEVSKYLIDRRLITPPALPRIHLSLPPNDQPPNFFAFKYVKFQELTITNLVPPSPQFLGYCSTSLRVLDLLGTVNGYGYVSRCLS